MTLGEALAGGHGDNPLAELYRDEALLIVHKPAGLLVHRSPIDRHETEFALQYARSLNGGRRVYPVHRLDRPTSGVLVFARDPDTARALGQAMMAGRVRKTYLAVVRGWPAASGVIDHPLRDEPEDRRLKDRAQTGPWRPLRFRWPSKPIPPAATLWWNCSRKPVANTSCGAT